MGAALGARDQPAPLMARPTRGPADRVNWPVVPPLVAVLGLLVLPLALVAVMSTRRPAPGFAGGIAGEYVFTLENYAVFLDTAYLRYLGDTLWLSLVATTIAAAAAYPMASWLATAPSSRQRKLAIGALMVILYASAVVKVYGVALAFGPTGLRPLLAAFWGVGLNNRLVTSTVVVVGLVNFLVPIATLMMVGPLQQVNPALSAAAQSLGANRMTTHLTVILPLCLPGVAQVFMLTYASAISAFVIPLILGRGQVNFLSNLVYARFSEVSDFPGGAALSMLLLAITLTVTLGLGWLVTNSTGLRPRIAR